MKTQIRILFAIFIVAAALGAARSALANINIITELDLESDHIYGNCRLTITTDEPYSAFNSNCNLDKDDVAIYGHPLPGYEIGYPRSTTWKKNLALAPALCSPSRCSVLCQVRGIVGR